MWTVKEVIDNSGMTIEEFANHYEIPVETLKEWYNDKENKRNLLDREITKKRKKESGKTKISTSKDGYRFAKYGNFSLMLNRNNSKEASIDNYDEIFQQEAEEREIEPVDIIIPNEIGFIKIKKIIFMSFSQRNIGTVKIENGIERIEDSAFIYCFNLRSISIPESVNYISKYAFKGCKNLDEQSRQKILSLAPETEFE
ncbi:leucine-rich repeat protein [Anaerofustis sp.]|uniref:leucine-rich repeat protein n=1 Tax=Anaerofustis sp. TaxID=1872517 RepID=UPI0025B8757C|nr:leucine-rich repeat protein [Anaerofustis sp.]